MVDCDTVKNHCTKWGTETDKSDPPNGVCELDESRGLVVHKVVMGMFA